MTRNEENFCDVEWKSHFTNAKHPQFLAPRRGLVGVLIAIFVAKSSTTLQVFKSTFQNLEKLSIQTKKMIFNAKKFEESKMFFF